MRFPGLRQTRFNLITVGYEILDGKILDTNSKWLAERITSMGGRVYRMMTVGDDVDEIAWAVRESIRDGVDWIITSGGLGPTYDDLTLKGVAKALKRKLVLSRRALEMLKRRYKELYERGVIPSPELTPQRIKMAMLPRGGRPLRNEVGSAPGVLLRSGRTRIACLPGVPSELKSIFENEVKPLIEKSLRRVYRVERWFEVRGIAESTLAPRLEILRSRNPNVYIKSHPRMEEGRSVIRLQLISAANRLKTAERRVEDVAESLREIVMELGGEFSPIKGDES
ncbi:MAG: hypothetical protein B6U65_02495 [Candidatus Wolframiiraptor sp. EX4484-121]|nr:MAG: hypothetical protein B6U65_02495 [Candidatus Wolframiiraptor sp. EX4484-121]